MAKNQEEKEIKESIEAKKIKKAETKIMYIGPTITNYGLIRNTVYETLSDSVLKLKEENRILESLFVDIKDTKFSIKLANISTNGTIENLAFEKAREVK